MHKLDAALPDFLQNVDGEVRLTGHRVGLYGLIARYQEGYSAEMLALHYPTLSLAHIHKVIAFYLENQQAVDAYVEQYHQVLEDLEGRNPTRVTLQMLRERIAKMHALALGWRGPFANTTTQPGSGSI